MVPAAAHTAVAAAVAAVAVYSSQSRIENAQTSGTLLETIGMTRNIDATVERERTRAARATKDAAQTRQGGQAEGSRSRYIVSSLVSVVHFQFCKFLRFETPSCTVIATGPLPYTC